LEIGLVIDVDYQFGNRLGIRLVIAPSITKIVTWLEIRITITRMAIGGIQTRNGSLDCQNCCVAETTSIEVRYGSLTL